MKPWYSSGLGRILLAFIFIAIWAFAATSKADVIEFPEEELSRESVLPVFDQPEALKKRLVPTEGRFEVDALAGFSMNDPFLNNYPLGVDLSYHLNEISSFGLLAAYVSSTQSQYVGQIQQDVPSSKGVIPFQLNPAPQYFALAEYEFTPYYGKISLNKSTVLNLNISATARLGMVGLSDSTSSVAGGLGLNERFFITRNFGIKADLAALIYQKGDVVPSNNGSTTLGGKTTAMNFYLLLGAVWYLPML